MGEEITIYQGDWYVVDEHEAFRKLISSALEAIPENVASRIRKFVKRILVAKLASSASPSLEPEALFER